MNVLCPFNNPCVDDAASLGNFSSEAPDELLFKGVYYKNMIWDGDINPFTACFGICTSTISQEEADQCAANNAADCEAAKQFSNVAQTCSLTCTDGSVQTYTTPAGLFVADSQAQADALAAEFCASLMISTCNELVPPGSPDYVPPILGPGMAAPVIPAVPPTPPGSPKLVANTQQSCSEACSCGGKSSTVAAGSNYGFNQQDADARALSICQKRLATLGCLTAFPTAACLGVSIGTHYVTSDNLDSVINYTWTVVGSLPPGITLISTPTQAVITGTPTSSGSFSFRIVAYGANGDTLWCDYTFHVMEIATGALDLPDGASGTPYSWTLAAGGSYILPLSWQLEAGSSLPDGLVLNETTGVISGTPTTDGDYIFTIVLQDSAT
jgi:hypothetical protein